MSTDLTSEAIKDTFGQVLRVAGTGNTGVDSTLKVVGDAKGNDTPLSVSTLAVQVSSAPSAANDVVRLNEAQNAATITTGTIAVARLPSIPLSKLTDPTTDTTIAMGSRTLTFNLDNPSGGIVFNWSGAASGHLFELMQQTGNVAPGTHLLHVEATDTDALLMHLKHNGASASLVEIEASNSTSTLIDAIVTGEANSRFKLLSDGQHLFGSGSGTQDLRLQRSTTKTLLIDDNASGSVTVDVIGTVKADAATIDGFSAGYVKSDSSGVLSSSAPSGSDISTGIVGSSYGGTGVNNAGRTLTISTNSGTIAFSAASSTLTIPETGTAALLATANIFTLQQTMPSARVGTSGTISRTLEVRKTSLSASTDGFDVILDSATGDTVAQFRVICGSAAGTSNPRCVFSVFSNGHSTRASEVALTTSQGSMFNIQVNGAQNAIFTTGGATWLGITTGGETGSGDLTVGGDLRVDTNVGFYGTTPVAQQSVTALTLAVGTGNDTLTDVGAAFNQTTLNNNFQDLVTKINQIRTALVNYGLL